MSGSVILSDDEKREMLIDARNPERRAAFAAARKSSQEGSLDDYIDFLSANITLVPPSSPRKHVTKNFRL
jgi:hypothetical protein